jgi:hypothetical protein
MQPPGAASGMSVRCSQSRSAEFVRFCRGAPTVDVAVRQKPSVELLSGCLDETTTPVTLEP